MTDDERCTRQPLSMTRRYRRGLILIGLLCALAVLAAAKVTGQALDQDSDRAMAEQFLSEAGERK